MKKLYPNAPKNFVFWLKKISILILVVSFIGLNGCGKNRISVDPKIGSISLDKSYLNKTIEREIDGKGQHIYQMSLADNQYINFALEQDGIDICIELFSPKNERLTKYDNQLGIKGDERFGFVSQDAGQYVIKVNATNNTAVLGKYSLKLRELRPAEAKDKKWFEAIKLLSLGKEKIEEQGERVKKGIEETLLSTETFKELNDEWHLCFAFNFIGNGYFILGDTAKAEEHYNNAISISKKLKDPHLESYSLDSVGLIAGIKGDLHKCVEFHNQSLQIVTELKDDGKKAYLLNNLANAFAELGELEKSAGYLSQSIDLHRKYGRADQLGVSIMNLGVIYNTLQEFEKSIPLYSEALKVTDNLRLKAYVNQGLSVGYSQIGDLNSAEKYNAIAIEDFKKIGDSNGLIVTFGQSGVISIARGDKVKALKALKAGLELAKDTPVFESIFLSKIGFIEQSLGNTQEAYAVLDKSLSICEKKELPFQKMLTLLTLGKLEAGKPNYSKAKVHLENSLQIAEKLKIIGFEAEILFNLAKVAFQQGDTGLAEKRIKECLEVSKLIRAIGRLQDYQFFVSSKVKDYYDLYIEILIMKYKKSKDLQYLESAWRYLEESRARVLLEMLKKNFSTENASDSDLLQQEATLDKRIAGKVKEKIDVLTKDQNVEKLEKLERQILELKTQYQNLELQIKQQQPQRLVDEDSYIDLALPKIQKDLLDENSTVLEYHFGISNYVFRIEKDKFDYFEIPKEELSKTIDSISTLNIFTAPSNNEKLDERKQLYLKILNIIHKTLLGKVGENLKNRLIIVPDGVISQIPWSALVDNNNQVLLSQHEIVLVPSVKTLLLQKEASRNSTSDEVEDALVFADPIYELTDQRVKNSDLIAKNESSSFYKDVVEQSITNLGLRQGFSRLFFTEKEAANIKTAFPKAIVFSGADASLEKLFGLPARKYRFIHFATHGFSNNSEPNLSSVVLSLYDENGQAKNGYLTVSQINRLKISAYLVVLSACQTGQGKQIKGEGAVGLSWAFMANNSPRVVSTLWSVNDEFTSLLMTRFYRNMLVENQTPLQALRNAQLEMIKDDKWADPYYWAAFNFQGIWN